MTDYETKRCCTCGEAKPLDEFYRHAKQPDGRQGACKACQNARDRRAMNADYYARTRDQQRQRRREYGAAYYAANKVTINAKIIVLNRERHRREPEKYRAEKAKYWATLRARVIAHLGGVCVMCGYLDARALQVDHVRNDGAADRKERSNDTRLRDVLKDTSGRYQLLCANCNWAKRLSNLQRSESTVSVARRKDRVDAVNALGGKCARCGHADIDALHIDHVNGGGCRERRAVVRNIGYYKRLAAQGPTVAQVLCACCNWIKKAENPNERSGHRPRLVSAPSV